MSDARLSELLNAELDGDLDSSEHRELEKLLQGDNEARQARQEFVTLDRLLRNASEQAPPASLHQQIVAKVRLPQAMATSWFSNKLGAPGFRYGLAAAASVLLAVTLYFFATPIINDAPDAEMIGSMVPNQGSETGNVIDLLNIVGAGYSSEVELRQRGGQLIMIIALEATRPVEIDVDFDNSGMQFDTLAEVDGQLEAVTYRNSVLHLRGQGHQEIQVFLRRAERVDPAEKAEILLEFSSAGQQPERGSLKSVY